MKKIAVLFLLLIFMLTACNDVSTPSDTPSGDASNNTVSDETIDDEYKNNGPYPIYDIPDEMFTTLEHEKIFDGTFIKFNIPVDWKCKELNAEDGSMYYFYHPELGKKCEFLMDVTFSEYFNKRKTEDEYLNSFLNSGYENFKIESFKIEKIDGYESTKAVSSYSSENTEFIRMDYDDIVVGFRLYSFTVTYPASERETFEPIFDSIVNSIDFIETE